MTTYIVTGAAGFIGFHLSNLLISEGHSVVGIDNFNDYYDVSIKKARISILESSENFSLHELDISDYNELEKVFVHNDGSVVINLAAQAGVRYSLENPAEYFKSNILGMFNILELSRKYNIKHLLGASTSSVYGSNKEMPFTEVQKCDEQLSFYAASKKTNETMSHSYSHNYKLPVTLFRFFTVYGPWGRPDMALFKFTKAILSDQPIDVYNNGEMFRDFTFVDDLVLSIYMLSKTIPETNTPVCETDSISTVAPWRVVNIGNSEQIRLMEYIETLERELKITATKNFLPMQMGDVPATLADTSLLQTLTDYHPSTSVKDGIRAFVNWYRKYYDC